MNLPKGIIKATLDDYPEEEQPNVYMVECPECSHWQEDKGLNVVCEVCKYAPMPSMENQNYLSDAIGIIKEWSGKTPKELLDQLAKDSNGDALLTELINYAVKKGD